MKKYLLILCALLLTAVGASAQVDYTSKISNTQDGWTGATAAYSQGGSGVERYQTTVYEAGKVLYQSIAGLPAGTYSVTFYAAASYTSGRGFTSETGTGIAQVFANKTTESISVVDVGDDLVSLSDYSHTLTCTVGANGILEYGLQNIATGGNWYVAQGVSLTLTQAASTVTLAQGDVLDDEGDENHLLHWSQTFTSSGSNGALDYNTWSGEAGMTVPYQQVWVNAGSSTSPAYLSDQTIDHEQFTGLPAGYYTVTVDARVLSELDNAISTKSAYFIANGQKVDLVELASTDEDFSYGTATEHEVNGSYDIMAEVTEDGTLDIGFSVTNATYNWISWKNLKVVYEGEELQYSIGEPQCSVSSVLPGEELTITFDNCITPDTDETPVLASGKSITVNGTAVDAELTTTGLTASVTITIPESVGYGETVTVIVPAGLLTWANYPAVSSPTADVTFTLSTPSMTNQEGVYLLNCHIDEFISRGYAWGTEADADQYGIPVNIEIGDDGLYTIQFVDNSLYLGYTGWAYTDCSGANVMHYSIESYNENGLSGYRFKCEEASTEYGGDCYLYVNESGDFLIANNGHAGTLNGDAQNYSEVSQTVWQILSMEERDAHKAAFVESQKDAIAGLVSAEDLDEYIASKVVNDVTMLVVNPNFSGVSTTGTSGWVASSTNTSGNNASATSISGGGMEVYNGCEQIQQTITGLEEGVYKIDLNGLYRQASNAVCWPYKDYDLSIAYIDANGYQINLKSWGSEATYDNSYSPDNTTQAYTACLTGYANELYTYVGSDGELVITITNPGHVGSEWMYVRGMALTYYGAEIEDDDEYKTGDVVTVDEVQYTVKSGNLFVNGGFNNGMIGWTAGGYTTDAFPSDYDVQSSGGFNENAYLTASSAGVASEKTPSQAIAVESGKTYLFIGYTSGTTPDSGNLRYSALFEMEDATTEASHTEGTTTYSNTIIQLEWGADSQASSDTWTQTIGVFTATTDYVGMRMGWSAGCYDGFQLYEVQAPEETIKWEMTSAGWGTMIIPFDAEIPSGLTLYAGDALTLDDTTITVGTVSETIAANTPYLVSGSAATYEFTGVATNTADTYSLGLLVGTLADMSQDAGDFTANSGQYVLQNHTDDGEGLAFYLITDESTGVTLDAYHCYLTTTSGISALNLPGMSTGIEAVESELIANDAIYDLSGRRVAKAVKGVYIMNGKKVLVK